MVYPYESINLNSNEVFLSDIISSRFSPQSPFEKDAVSFIRRWFSNEEEFHLHTSGSTGPAKEITIKRSQMIASATATAHALDLRQGDTALICLDPAYIAGQMMFVRSFNTGMRIIATEPSSNPLSEMNGESRIDFTALVPFQLSRILQSPLRKRLNNIGTAIVGGAAVSREIIHQLDEFKCVFVATYGMTETISHIALQLLNGPGKSDFFKALPGVRISVDDRGCLKVDVPYLDHPLITNDLVEIKSYNEFLWLGRVDNIINTGGVKVSPERIEERLETAKSALSLHQRFVISARENPELGQEIVCVIEAERLDNEVEQMLRLEFSRLLGRFEVPKAILCIRELPQTKTGKIDRTALKNLINNQH